MIRLAISILGVFMMTIPAYAAHPLITDDTGTQGKGKGQVEIGLSYYYDKDKLDEVSTYKTEGSAVTAILTLGLLDTLDIVLGVPYIWLTTEDNNSNVTRANGLSDITLDLKWRFFEKDGWSLAVKPGISLPSGDADNGLGAGRTAYRLFFITTKELGPAALHLNLGYIWNENNADERRDIWHASLAAEYEVIKDLKIMANVGVERDPASGSSNNPAFALGGLSYNISERIIVDAGVKFGLTSPETDITFLAGITVKF
jgi:hypothetical protein